MKSIIKEDTAETENHFVIAKIITDKEESIVIDCPLDFGIIITNKAIKLKLIFHKIQDWLIPLLPKARYLFEIRQWNDGTLVERLKFNSLEFVERIDNVVLYNILDLKQ